MEKIKLLRRLALLLASGIVASGIAAAGAPAFAQSWPTQPVKLVVPFPPGGGTDLLARELADKLSKKFGQSFVVENRPGAGAAVGTEYVARATDGHTFLFTSSNHVTVPALNTKLRYDIFKDFKPIVLVADQASVLAVDPALPGKDLKEVLAYIKANPGKFNYGTAGIGSGQHLNTAYLQQLTGIDIVHVPLKGQGEIIAELLGKRIQVGFLVLSTSLPYFKSGEIRPLGVATAERSKFAPDIPTIEEAGVNAFVSRSWLGLLGPASTPDAVVKELNTAIVDLAKDPSYLAVTDKAGMTLVNSTPAEFEAEIRRGYEQWKQVVATANIQTQ
ncbi:tripartite-type tricarboxylate transporter receptor subunit TctC [Angulomicrobium tetraedrale]|uniref:Tripartite-type tricarboxylate transporter receptor subunit TctC n=1 Tax=Ancylobacter tetraedralis TaxID=217068 RepID=A0A839Z4V1_9HYPH|nr:tripartite tricarboxylate transporter substrate binding protein [Ancylobacter tetraedralis]MBB3770023.1 tripartite-type tricarboxylate transporter receptor subunit TctC [Ancylobacter tetraedralis]